MQQPCGWFGRVEEFVNVDRADWLDGLKSHHLSCMKMNADASQVVAWENSFPVMTRALGMCMTHSPEAARWHVVFEYELPRERGRRPDVVLLAGPSIVVLEFKDFRAAIQAHIDQVSAYARDINHYQAASHAQSVTPVLVLTRSSAAISEHDEVQITGPDQLAQTILNQVASAGGPIIDPLVWIDADYAPLPSLVTAARTIFQHEPLPRIRRASSAGIPETIAELVTIAREAESSQGLHLALVHRG